MYFEMRDGCGNCIHHKPASGPDDSWVCENEESEYFGMETEYADTCEDWEEKHGH